MGGACRVRQGTAVWAHAPEGLAEIAVLETTDELAWQRLGELIRRSQTMPLGSRVCLCQTKSVERIGELIVDKATNPAKGVRYFFTEAHSASETLGLHVLEKPSSYETLGMEETRALQNLAIATADERLTSHLSPQPSEVDLQNNANTQVEGGA